MHTNNTNTHQASIQTCHISSWQPTTHCSPFPKLPHIFDPEARECRVETGQMSQQRWGGGPVLTVVWMAAGPTRQRLSVCAVCPPNLLMYSWGQEVLHQINGRDLHSFPLECAWSALLSTAGGETSSLAELSNFPQNLTTEKLTGEEEASDSPRWHNSSHWIILIDKGWKPSRTAWNESLGEWSAL